MNQQQTRFLALRSPTAEICVELHLVRGRRSSCMLAPIEPNPTFVSIYLSLHPFVYLLIQGHSFNYACFNTAETSVPIYQCILFAG
jgi:hypothetical protein